MNQNNNNNKRSSKINPLELLREAGKTGMNTLNDELLSPLSQDVINQIFVRRPTQRKVSAEILPGESLEMSEFYSEERQLIEKKKKQIELQRSMQAAESAFIEKRMNELKLEIKAIKEEIIKIANATPKLTRELEEASFAETVDANTYELNFLQHIFDMIKKFRENIESASTWLAAFNQRSKKRNVWGANYKKGGAKYLLSNEHYLTRSAG